MMAATTADPRKLPAPEANAETQVFWDAAAAGTLMIKRCGACGRPHYYPRALCPFCLSDDTRWEAAAGTGTLYSYSVMRRGAGAPFTLAYVTLDEGPAVLTNIVGDPDALAIGQRMAVDFVATDGPPVPMFRPATT